MIQNRMTMTLIVIGFCARAALGADLAAPGSGAQSLDAELELAPAATPAPVRIVVASVPIPSSSFEPNITAGSQPTSYSRDVLPIGAYDGRPMRWAWEQFLWLAIGRLPPRRLRGE